MSCNVFIRENSWLQIRGSLKKQSQSIRLRSGQVYRPWAGNPKHQALNPKQYRMYKSINVQNEPNYFVRLSVEKTKPIGGWNGRNLL
jgi:hypothetical protein